MEKIMVLGATGNIGTAVLKGLQGKNALVYAGIRSDVDSGKVNTYGAQPVRVDFTQPESLQDALKGMHRVFLVTPLMENPEVITRLVIDAARQNGLKHIVRRTATGADSEGHIRMARWAGASEDLIKSSGMNYTILRPYQFLQNFINFHSHSIRNYAGFYVPNGQARMSVLDVRDLGEIAAIALTSDDHFGKVYELSGLSYTNDELAEALSTVLEKKISYVDVSEDKARESMLANQMPEWMVDAMMELNGIIKQGWTNMYSDDYRSITGKEYTSAQTFFEENKLAFV
ncbi:MAG: SDR family oxidoreductase [Bacteroidota bacterium]